MGNILSSSPTSIHDIEVNPFTNFANSVIQRVHALTTLKSGAIYELPKTNLKSVTWVLNKYKEGILMESRDITSLILVFENISFSEKDIIHGDVVDVVDVDKSEPTPPDTEPRVARIHVNDTEEVELVRINSEPASSVNKLVTLETELADLIAQRSQFPKGKAAKY